MTTPLFMRLKLQSLIKDIIKTHGTDLALDIVQSAVQKEMIRENLLVDPDREPGLMCEQSL